MKNGTIGTVALVLLGAAATKGDAQAGRIPPAAEQIAGAVSALPKGQRDGATVLDYGADGKMTVLRKGTGGMTCLASDPAGKEFHSACTTTRWTPSWLAAVNFGRKVCDELEDEE